ncbi:hypothetical protein HZA56_06960 [Candidatus Poribacteria bacterium]|nr:hypothetical protein [Candidatus Poribacteria bacterium]
MKSADKKMFRGWLFDIYSGERGMTLWLIGTDGRRVRLEAPYRPSFFVAGTNYVLERVKGIFRQRNEQAPSYAPRNTQDVTRDTQHVIRNTEHAIRNTPHAPVSFSMTEQRDFWSGRAVPVLRVTTSVRNFHSTVKQIAKISGAELYNCDIPPEQMYLYETGLFPLALCEVEIADDGTVASIRACDSPWDIDYSLPPLEIFKLSISGNGANPNYGGKGHGLKVEVDGTEYLLEESELLDTLDDMLKRYDPDLLLTEWGDSFIIPRLTLMAERQGHPLSLNREPKRSTATRRGSSYFSYGRIIYRAPSRTLFGRWHIDVENSFIASETGLDGLFELARLTKIPIQRLARTSPGTGISSMQLDMAIHDGVLIPWRKRMPEDFKTGLELLVSDKGGLVYLPKPGVYENVMEIDFASMYPAIMVNHNISPETINCSCCEGNHHDEKLSQDSVGANLSARPEQEQDGVNVRINSHLQKGEIPLSPPLQRGSFNIPFYQRGMKGDLPDSSAQLQDNHGGKPHEGKFAAEHPVGEPVPEIGHHVCRKRRGLVPRVLEPILEKRRIYKEIANTNPPLPPFDKEGENKKAKGKEQIEEKAEIPLFPPLQRGSLDFPLYHRGMKGDLGNGEKRNREPGARQKMNPTPCRTKEKEKEITGECESSQQSLKGDSDDSVGATRWVAQEPSSQRATRRVAPTKNCRMDSEKELSEQIRDLKASCKKRQNALKWMLVTCFGYLGYKNARFGRIEAHEAVTALGREKLLQAKEIAERRGFELVHAIVDSLWVSKTPKEEERRKGQREQRDNSGTPCRKVSPNYRAKRGNGEKGKVKEEEKDQQGLLREISESVGIPIALEGNYRWIAFVPSRTAPTVAVANRYFGLFDNGEMKMRGLEVRRSDIPPIVRRMQAEMLKVLSSTSTAEEFARKAPEILEILKRYLARLRSGEVQAADLVISQKLSKNPSEYKTNTAMAAAAGTLLASGIKPQPGERVELILVDSKAHGQATKAIPYTASVENIDAYDVEKYSELLIRAAETVLLRRLEKKDIEEELL